jgi:protein SPT2
MKARDREGQDSVSPPPNLREYSTLTREEKRKKKEAAMLGLVTIGKRKAPSFSSHVQQQMKTASAANGLVPLGTHKRDTRSVDEIERDLIASRRAKISMQGSRSQRDKLLEEEKREKELETMLRRTKAMQEKRSMEESRQKSMTRSGSDSSDEERRPSNGRHKIDLSASMSAKPKSKNYEPKRDNSSSNSGLNPADYLPGAPIKTSILPKAVNKPRQAAAPVKSKRDTSRDAIEKAGPPKKETPREKFLREEAEKKRQRERQRESRKKIEDVSDEEDSDSEEEDESKEGESEESEEEDLPHSSKRAKIRDEIWSLFNRKDKSEYLARDIDSDDDMEADMESVRREEERSARIARLEDKREEEAQRRREQEKAQRKAAKERR